MSEAANGDDNESPEKDERIRRASEVTRAYRIRKKIKQGITIDGEEKKWFDNYEANKRQQGPAGGVPEADEPGTTPGIDATPAETAEPDTGVAPPPPPPPRVATAGGVFRDDGKREGQSDGDWRKRYRGGGQDGRERTVLAIASQWRGALEFMSEQIKMSGGTPMIPVDELWPHIVITVDDMLPEKVKLKPSHIAVGGTTVLLAQRIARNKKVNEAYERGAKGPGAAPASEPSPPAPESAREPVAVTSPVKADPTPAPVALVVRAEPPAPVVPPIRIPVETAPTYEPGPGDVW